MVLTPWRITSPQIFTSAARCDRRRPYPTHSTYPRSRASSAFFRATPHRYPLAPPVVATTR